MFFDGGDLVRAFDNLILSKNIFEKLQEKGQVWRMSIEV
jgi:hypothetical protein